METPFMKLMTFEKGTGTALGLVEGDTVLDLGAGGIAVPKDLRSLIALGPSAQETIKASAARAPASARHPVSALKAALPIARPPKFICVGLNYALHAKEGG